ncbi:MAG: hypothetical protein M3O70_08755 [Actinomycetota bacterium]|nr:hypothetical protein [Actinomycetota bacterium]
MRALTVKQPWTDLIMAGVKDVENRPWPPPSTLPQWNRCYACGQRRPPGEMLDCLRVDVREDGPFPFRLGIHAGKTVDRDAIWALSRVDLQAIGVVRRDDAFDVGVLLGFVTVTGCHHADECADERPCGVPSHRDGCVNRQLCSGWAQPDQYHWRLADPEPLDGPVPMRGRQGLWSLYLEEPPSHELVAVGNGDFPHE